MATEFDKLIDRTSKTAHSYGGLVSLLLAIRQGKADTISWDSDQARFRVRGNEVDPLRIQAELVRIDSRLSATIALYTQRLSKGEWTLKKWKEEMKKLLEEHHIIFGALALGSIVTSARDNTVKRRLARDLKYLTRFSRVVQTVITKSTESEASTPLLPEKGLTGITSLIRRGRSYIRSLTMTYHLLNQQAHILAGYTEARRILTPAEHCKTKGGLAGCLETALRGWIAIRDMPPIGTLVCKQFCRCYIIYRK